MASTRPVKTRLRMMRYAVDAIAAGRWAGRRPVRRAVRRAVRLPVRQVRVRVVVRASGRQRGSVIRGSVRVRECVVVSASRQAAEAARKSRDEIRLG